MTQTLRAHFDGKVIVPDEPVDIPVDQPLRIQLEAAPEEGIPDRAVIEERLRRLARTTGCISAPSIPLEALRRENLYEERSLPISAGMRTSPC